MKRTTQNIAKKTAFLIFAFFLNATKFLFLNFIDFVSVIAPLPQSKENIAGKRILIFNWRDTRHAYSGGAEVYIHEMAKRWVKSGNKVVLFCGNDSKAPRYEVIDGIEIIRRGGFYFVYVWAFLYYIVRFRGHFDVIIDCENGIPFFTPLYSREKIFLLIHHVHQEVFRKSLKPPFSWIASYLEMHIMPYVYRNVEIITVSNSSKKDIQEYGISKREPIVIHNGVDLENFKPAEKNGNPLILYLGRLKFYKSVHVFVQAAQQVLEKVPTAEFVIAGFGEEEWPLRRLAKKLNIEKHIKFVGKVSEAEKIKLYQKAWVFVNPSFMEGWGITSIEANACGTPVVASNVPGLRDAVLNPSSGFLVPYGQVDAFAEKITLLITDTETRKTMSKKSIDWASKFDWQKSADEGLKIINQN